MLMDDENKTPVDGENGADATPNGETPETPADGATTDAGADGEGSRCYSC